MGTVVTNELRAVECIGEANGLSTSKVKGSQ
jgi:hypothetical protein